MAPQLGTPAIPSADPASAMSRVALKALTPAEEDYAAALWDIHREAKLNAVTMAFAGIQYATGTPPDGHALEAKLQPIANFFNTAEFRVRALVAPDSLQQIHAQYLQAMTLYATAAAAMLKTARDGGMERLIEAQGMSQRASEDLLRVGEVLWPGEYKPN
jgi:hypothetical protein